MQPEMKDRIIYELVVTAAGTLIFLGIWFLAEMPEWKREEYLSRVKSMRMPRKTDSFIREIQRFQSQIATWEHEQLRGNVARPDQ